MLTLVTTNPSKYTPFVQELDRLRIDLAAPKHDVPELQSLTFAEALAHKAEAMANMFGRPVLVDDAGLILEEYAPFPGPLTSAVLRSLGQKGLERLTQGGANRAAMECHLGWWSNGKLKSWTGRVTGNIDVSRHVENPRMLLSDLFVPDPPFRPGTLAHRGAALAALEADAFELHLETAPPFDSENPACAEESVHQCPFCTELEGNDHSIFAEMIRDRMHSRILYEDEDFVVMPPLGQFMEGGLLLLTRRHITSFAHLAPSLFPKLERLLQVIRRELADSYRVPPLVFEHGPAFELSKGKCCVDHAHFNIFPAKLTVHPHLTQRMNFSLGHLSELSRLKPAEFGYLYIQENDGTMRAYDAKLVPTQLVRRIVTSNLGMPERWHWRDYPGYDELIATYQSLKGRIHL